MCPIVNEILTASPVWLGVLKPAGLLDPPAEGLLPASPGVVRLATGDQGEAPHQVNDHGRASGTLKLTRFG